MGKIRLISLVLPLLSTSVGAQEYYDGMFARKVPEVQRLIPKQKDAFLFWTDTHLNANTKNTPSVMKRLVGECGIQDCKVFWGGDAVPAFGDDPMEFWNIQAELNRQVMAFARNYNVRGNHDITIKFQKTAPEGVTVSQSKTASLFRESMQQDVCRNPADPDGLYYYFDEPSSRIRYMFMETNDSCEEGTVAWKVNPTFGEVQRKWFFDEVIPSTPKHYSLIFICHRPLAAVFEIGDNYSALRESINNIGKNRPDLQVLMVLSGDCHHDFATYQNGILYVTTASNAYYNDFTRSPLHEKDDRRVAGTDREQVFDYVSINRKSIDMIRIGACSDRFFSLVPIKVKGTFDLSRKCPGAVSWLIYDSTGGRQVRGEGYSRRWLLRQNVAAINGQGLVTSLSEGEAVAVGVDAAGGEHYFYIRTSK